MVIENLNHKEASKKVGDFPTLNKKPPTAAKYIKSLISSKFIELEDNSIEEICVCLQKTSGNIYIFNSYIPPQS